LGLPEVQKELEVMDDQIAKLKGVEDEYRQKIQKEFGDLRNLPEDQRRTKYAEFQEKRRTWNEEAVKKVQEILLPPQWDRLHEISIQVRGTSALSDPKVQEELGLTEQQKTKIQEIGETAGNQMRAMFEGSRGLSEEQRRARRAEDREKMTKMWAGVQEQTLATLTAEQRDKFEQMKGKKIEIQWPQRGPGAPPGGGPGGPGNRDRSGRGPENRP
jgi:hypothetical protein